MYKTPLPGASRLELKRLRAMNNFPLIIQDIGLEPVFEVTEISTGNNLLDGTTIARKKTRKPKRIFAVRRMPRFTHFQSENVQHRDELTHEELKIFLASIWMRVESQYQLNLLLRHSPLPTLIKFAGAGQAHHQQYSPALLPKPSRHREQLHRIVDSDHRHQDGTR